MSIASPKHPDLADEIAAYLAAHGMAPTTFGVKAANDPALISTLRDGRELRRDTIQRIRRFMVAGQAQT